MPADAQAPESLSPLSPEVQKCPYDWYTAMHAQPEGLFDAGPLGYVVTRYDELAALAFDTENFSAQIYGPNGPPLTGVSPEPYSTEVQAFFDTLPKLDNALICADPPTLTRQKVIANKSVNISRIRKLEPTIRAEANALLDAFIDNGRCDLFAEYAMPLPVIMIGQLLGLGDDRAKLKRWTLDIADGFVGTIDNARRLEVLKSVQEFTDDLKPRLEARRANPTDDLLSTLVHTEFDDEHGDGDGPRHLTEGELISIVSQMLTAGNTTTTDLIVNTLTELITHPDAMAEVQADPSLIPAAVDESMRKDAPLRGTFRICTSETEISGTKIPVGTMVAMMWGGANHDPTLFPEPAKYDIHRPNLKKHLGFGNGPHICVGMPLGRAVSRIAFEVLLSRVTNIRFAEGFTPGRVANFSFTIPTGLEIEFDKLP